MKIVYVYDAIARIGGVEKILADKMNYFADVCAYDIYLITAAQGNHPFSFPISARVKHIDLNARFHLQYQYKAPLRWWMKWRLDCDFERKIKKQIAQIDPDIIIATTYYKADVVCRLECRAKKIIESHCVKSHTGINDGIKRSKPIQLLYDFYSRRASSPSKKRAMPSYRSPKETVRNGMQTVNENLSYPIPYPRFHPPPVPARHSAP